MEAALDVGARKIGDQPPRGVLPVRTAEDDEARSTRGRDPRPVRPRHRRGRPDMLAIRRQAAAELADLPRPGDAESEAPAIALVQNGRASCRERGCPYV